MELDLITSDMSEEDNLQVCYDNDMSSYEEERCGICMDVVIDRGVLDCCQHWYCFVCIDNWATITNLCPLCQNEFQLITCVPVYDTTGSNKVEDDSFSGDDDEWCIEGKNNSLSFPSYYIDENSVVCLDGEDCKIRSGSKVDDDLNYDTSIACDSCDIWYHAFCVGFDPENTTESTWLCPRCMVDMPQRLATTSVHKPSDQNGSITANCESSVDAVFSRKLSVSVADDGETAVVVSLVGENQWSKEEDDTEQNANISKVEKSLSRWEKTDPKLDVQDLAPSSSHEKPSNIPSTSASSEYNEICADKEMKNELGLDGIENSWKEPYSDSCSREMSKSESIKSLLLGLSMSSFLSGGHVKNIDIKNQGEVQQQKNSSESIPLGDNMAHDAAIGNVGGSSSLKRKHISCSEDVLTQTKNGEIKTNTETEIYAKKIKTTRKTRTISPSDQTNKSNSDDFKKQRYSMAMNKDDNGSLNMKKDDATFDIMSIVQGTDAIDKTSKEREAGVRVKKIVRRPIKDKESSIIVQNLRKEIREAIQNKSSVDFGKKLFDPKLLAAFRTAIAGPAEPTKMSSQLVVRAKKTMLQKGKARENLTKKIYGINGRRKRAWDRDCEVEFWKHRCMRPGKPEKIDTLKSVLDLLKSNNDTGNEEKIEKKSELNDSNPILSRLYLADTSVFPRKDDIIPLANLKIGGGQAELNEQKHNPMERTLFDKEKKDVLCLKGKASSSKVNVSKSSISGSKVNKKQKEKMVKAEDVKIDKRKWALEVLARKTAVQGGNATRENQGDNDKLKVNYPLLAQLPVDMRPVLASIRHNKVPISIRQAQLYRLTEHLLRKTNQPVIHRTGETELAVADAVNIEKEVADKSTSKLIYVNLCSLELTRRSSNINRELATNPSPLSHVATYKSEEKASTSVINADAEEALRTAGLLSDSPPNSPPHQEIKDGDEKKSDGDKTREGLDNIFEMNSHQELDIYGDFEYDLGDEDYIGATAINTSKIQSEEESSKIKVVFSTLTSDKLNNTMICETSDKELVKSNTDKSDESIRAVELVTDETGEDLSIAECEELYGPDKEPLVLAEEKIAGCNENNAGNQSNVENHIVAINEEKTSSNNSQTGEHVPRKNKSEKKSKKVSDIPSSVSKKVEAYIKEHIRPLCKSGVISVEQYRWAVAKTTEKVMKFHSKDKNASFLIKEGEKVKKLAEQYVEAAQKEK